MTNDKQRPGMPKVKASGPLAAIVAKHGEACYDAGKKWSDEWHESHAIPKLQGEISRLSGLAGGTVLVDENLVAELQAENARLKQEYVDGGQAIVAKAVLDDYKARISELEAEVERLKKFEPTLESREADLQSSWDDLNRGIEMGEEFAKENFQGLIASFPTGPIIQGEPPKEWQVDGRRCYAEIQYGESTVPEIIEYKWSGWHDRYDNDLSGSIVRHAELRSAEGGEG